MALKGNAKREKRKLWQNVLYYAVVLCLVFILIVMYGNWRKRSQQYQQLVQEASLQDQTIVIEPREADDLRMDNDP